MYPYKSLRTRGALLGVALFLPLILAAASEAQEQQSDSQSSSVADAARRNRNKKKDTSDAAKTSKVITDDDLDRRNFQPGQEGLNIGAPAKLETEPPSPQAVAGAEAADKAGEQEAADQDAQVAKLKLQIEDAEKDQDVAKRQLALDQDSYFANSDYAHDASGKAKLDAEKQQIGDMQSQIEKLKMRLAALEELKSHRKSSRKQAEPKPETPANAPPQTQKPQ
jgi:hypothetical protein